MRLPVKRVSVSHIGEDLVAVKIDGDACVPAGLVTFRGRLSRARVDWAICPDAGMKRSGTAGVRRVTRVTCVTK
jgi:hypothetical protein